MRVTIGASFALSVLVYRVGMSSLDLCVPADGAGGQDQGGTVMCYYIGKAAEAPGQLNDVTDRLILAHFTETSVWKLMLLCALAKPI